MELSRQGGLICNFIPTYFLIVTKYFLLTISNKKVVYSSTPMLLYSTYELASPSEYYQKKTRLIDIIGNIILLTCIIITIKIGIFNFLRKSGTSTSWETGTVLNDPFLLGNRDF